MLTHLLFTTALLCGASEGAAAHQPDTGPATVPSTQPGLPPVSEEEREALSGRETVFVRAFRFEGNTVFTDRELATELAGADPPLVGRDLTIDQLEQARQLVTLKYVNAGYINSGAVLSDQDVADGVVTLHVVEGKLDPKAINLARHPVINRKTGATTQPTPRLRDSYLRSRIAAGAGRVLNIEHLRDRLQILRDNPNIERINAELRPGLAPGEAMLDVTLAERSPWRLAFEFHNKQSPSVGAERLEVYAANTNLSGRSDALSLRWAITRGGFDELEFADLDDVSVDYALPINAQDTTLIASFSRSDALVIETPFEDLDITSETDTYALTVRHPFDRTASRELAGFVTLTYRENESFLLGEPFSFSPGAEDGESTVFVVRFGPEFFWRSQTRALALRSTFSVGLDALGATDNGDDDMTGDEIPDGQFFAWLGQAQFIQRLWQTDNQLILRAAAQLTPDRLLSLEQFAVGGYSTVRGYRESAVVRDNAVVLGAELRFPMFRQSDQRYFLELAPFADFGYAWNTDDALAPDESLPSVGIGLLMHPLKNLDLAVYYGYAFEDLNDEDTDDLQDHGVHFSILWTVF